MIDAQLVHRLFLLPSAVLFIHNVSGKFRAMYALRLLIRHIHQTFGWASLGCKSPWRHMRGDVAVLVVSKRIISGNEEEVCWQKACHSGSINLPVRASATSLVCWWATTACIDTLEGSGLHHSETRRRSPVLWVSGHGQWSWQYHICRWTVGLSPVFISWRATGSGLKAGACIQTCITWKPRATRAVVNLYSQLTKLPPISLVSQKFHLKEAASQKQKSLLFCPTTCGTSSKWRCKICWEIFRDMCANTIWYGSGAVCGNIGNNDVMFLAAAAFIDTRCIR